MTEVNLDVERTGGRGRNESFLDNGGELLGTQSVPMDILYVAEWAVTVEVIVQALQKVVTNLRSNATVRGARIDTFSTEMSTTTDAEQVIIALKSKEISVDELVTRVRRSATSTLLIVIDSARTEASEADVDNNLFITNESDLAETLRTVLWGSK